MGSGCDVLQQEPERFLTYLLADPKIRASIYDEASFGRALRRVLESDSSLSNIVGDLDKNGDNIEICGENIFARAEIQNIVKSNVKNKRASIKRELKKTSPSLSGPSLRKEIDKRLRASIGAIKGSLSKKTRQATIDASLRPVKVTDYTRGGKQVSGYRRGKGAPLTKSEQDFLVVQIQKGLKPAQATEKYLAAGYAYRTKTSIKRHYYRLKQKIATSSLRASSILFPTLTPGSGS